MCDWSAVLWQIVNTFPSCEMPEVCRIELLCLRLQWKSFATWSEPQQRRLLYRVLEEARWSSEGLGPCTKACRAGLDIIFSWVSVMPESAPKGSPVQCILVWSGRCTSTTMFWGCQVAWSGRSEALQALRLSLELELVVFSAWCSLTRASKALDFSKVPLGKMLRFISSFRSFH